MHERTFTRSRSLTQRREGAKRYRVSGGLSLRLCAFARDCFPSGWARNRLPILVACATFFLIIAGALVTSHDAGLATSDWPLSNGQFFPRMVGNLFWEHGHRMVATTVGLLTIALTIYLLRKEKRSWVRSSASLHCSASSRRVCSAV